MAVTRNMLIPVLGVSGLVIVGTILYQQFATDGPVRPAGDLKTIPAPEAASLPTPRGADNDNPSETLKTVVASNAELRDQVQRVIDQNNKLVQENQRLARLKGTDSAVGATPTVEAVPASTGLTETPTQTTSTKIDEKSPFDSLGKAIGQAAITVQDMVDTYPTGAGKPTAGKAKQPVQEIVEAGAPEVPHGAIAYKTVAPMGFSAYTEESRGRGGARGPAVTRFVRTSGATEAADPQANGTASRAAQAAVAAKPVDDPYFTIPENATLVGVTAMTSLIGRVPIDGRVTDPMQFKAMVGRDNLAANGWELPDDLAGMIVTGVAIGDMALSCSEGKVRSVTFVFNDGTIRTVSNRKRGGNATGGGSSSGDIGFISDVRGNPCIVGKFVTNAPAYLTDIVGLKALGVASQAYSDAQRSITQNQTTGNTTSQVTGSMSKYVMGQAAAGATDEVTAWMLSRLKNSFDAVVTPAGQQLVVHIDQEIQLDKPAKARKLVHKQQTASNAQRGDRHGLE